MIGLGDVALPARLQTRAIAPAVAADLRLLYGSERRLVASEDDGAGACTWSFSTAPEGVSHGIDLAIAGEEPLTLALVADRFRDPIGERDWWDYPETTRLLSWTLAHERLLHAIGRLFGETPQPRKLHSGTEAPRDPRIAVGFVVDAEDGRSAQGRLALPPSLLRRLLAHPGWQTLPVVRDPGWEQLPASLTLSLPPLRLSRVELSRLQTGDVLVLGSRTQALRSLRLAAEAATDRWIGQADGAQLTLLQRIRNDLTPAANPSHPETRMTEPLATSAAAETPLTPLDQLPLTLEFEIGRLSVTLGELAALRPGYVFQLPAPADALRVTIRANGRAIGHGEVVAVGDVLGVQLGAIDPATGETAHGNG